MNFRSRALLGSIGFVAERIDDAFYLWPVAAIGHKWPYKGLFVAWGRWFVGVRINLP